MECYGLQGGMLRQKSGLWQTLGADPRASRLTAVVGGGGKTTLLYALAREAARMGLRVLLTTTTHIGSPPAGLWAQTEEQARALMQKRGAAVFVLPSAEEKCLPPPLAPEECLAFADLVLVEADGSRHLPLKAPAAHEPVLPRRPLLVIGMAGLDSIGKPLAQVCHRPQQGAALLGKTEGEQVAPQDLACLLSHPSGQKKGVKGPYRAVLNKADTPQALADAGRAAALLKERGIVSAVLHFDEEERGTCWQ